MPTKYFVEKKMIHNNFRDAQYYDLILLTQLHGAHELMHNFMTYFSLQ